MSMIRGSTRAHAAAVLLTILAFGITAPDARAHARLLEASPPIGGRVTALPDEIRLRFSEGVEPRFSSIDLANASGAQLVAARASINPADPGQLVLRLADPLGPGVYRVSWRIVARDGHKVEGTFSFEVSP